MFSTINNAIKVLIPNSIVIISDDKASWARNTELHLRWAAQSDLRHVGLKRCPQTWKQH